MKIFSQTSSDAFLITKNIFMFKAEQIKKLNCNIKISKQRILN